MNQKLLLLLLAASFAVGSSAQKNQKATTAYAITGIEKGSQRWTEVRLVDVNTGEEVQSIYESTKEQPILNARTGKPIVKKDQVNNITEAKKPVTFNTDMKDGDVLIIRRNNDNAVSITQHGSEGRSRTMTHRKFGFRHPDIQKDKPFSTKSAACAFDRKHNRLYYTPMGINQLRYIDLKSREKKIYYFEDESFGTVAGLHDVANQITRMTFGADGNGYALSNNGEHLLRFTTNKKAQITDLGSLQDGPGNAANSIHGHSVFGGDMVADDDNNLYLITAGKAVYKISIKDMSAAYLGTIKGLPRGFSTNGAAVATGTNIIISSANNTMGYYKFDLKTLEAEKVSQSEKVFNASDLANANLVSIKEEKKDEAATAAQAEARRGIPGIESPGLTVRYKMSVYPNPAVKGEGVYVRFNDFPAGRYNVQLFELSGKLISTENVSVGGKMQMHLLTIPKALSQGQYMVKVINDVNKEKILATEQIVVQ
jgi:uncharacterized protein (DUF2141 family)